MLPEHKMPITWQARHERATVAAGGTQFQAQAPRLLALGPIRTNLGEASTDADLMQRMFDAAPRHQHCAVAQAVQSLR